MKENNLCLEEYLTLLRNYTTENHLKIVNWDGEIYEVYYVPQIRLPIPLTCWFRRIRTTPFPATTAMDLS